MIPQLRSIKMSAVSIFLFQHLEHGYFVTPLKKTCLEDQSGNNFLHTWYQNGIKPLKTAPSHTWFRNSIKQRSLFLNGIKPHMVQKGIQSQIWVLDGLKPRRWFQNDYVADLVPKQHLTVDLAQKQHNSTDMVAKH